MHCCPAPSELTAQPATAACPHFVQVPLQVAEAASPGQGGVAVLPVAPRPPRYGEQRYRGREWELYRAVVADVLTLLPSTLLQEVGIQVSRG
jgi:hypothetical protein